MSQLIRENIYGHAKRLVWITSFLERDNTIIEFGCGTGYMITRPLARMGYNVIGLDLDEVSIAYGKNILQQEGLGPERLKALNISEFNDQVDVIIASEVLEHIPTENLIETLQLIRKKLKPGGKLLVTVPNGYGWFEIESFIWFNVRIGYLLEKLQIERRIRRLKTFFINPDIDYIHPSTLADSPHVQYYTYSSIQKLLRDQGFEIISATGSVLFAGPFSNLIFTGVSPVMKLNCRLGGLLPRVSAGFHIAARLTG